MKWFVFISIPIFTMVTNVTSNALQKDEGPELATRCLSEGYSIKILQKVSRENIGHGGFLILVCCPESHPEAIFFGQEGVGCCKVIGRKCVFKCTCKDGTDPIASQKPDLLEKTPIRVSTK